MRYLIVLLVVALLMPVSTASAKSKFWKAQEWFSRRKTSTTVTGMVDSVDGRTVMFKTHDGQMLQLIGKSSEKVGAQRGAVIRVFGNVRKPDATYPTGALDVRNFRVLEEGAMLSTEPVQEPMDQAYIEPEPVPEPYVEPVAEPYPEPYTEPYPEPYTEPVVQQYPDHYNDTAVSYQDDDHGYDQHYDATEPAPSQQQEYVVQAGDTLAKISSKLFGSTKHWKKLAEYNKITNPRALKVGMALQVPQL